MKILKIFLLFTCVCFRLQAQFAVDETTCLEAPIEITNTSMGVDSVQWDFCHNDLDIIGSFATAINIPSIRTYTTSTVFDNGEWHQFVSARNANEIHHLSYGSSLSNTPTVVDILDNTDLLGNLSLPRKMVFRKEANNWYALLCNLTSNSLIRLNFGADLSDIPSVDNLGNLSGWNFLHGIDLVEDNGNLIAIVSSINNNKLTLLNFGNSITNTPSGGDILDIGVTEPLVSGPYGVQIIKDNSEWIGFFASNTSGQLIKMSFGTTLMSEPDFTSEADLTGISDVALVREGFDFHLMAVSTGGTLEHYEYSANFSSTPIISSQTITNNNYNFEIVRGSPVWHAFTTNWAGRIVQRHSFSVGCDGSSINLLASNDETPTDLFYYNSDDYILELTNYLSGGNVSIYEDTITVINQFPSDITFLIDEYRCINVTNSFSSINVSGDISTYSWDFNDDGTEDSNLENPSYTFGAAGTYTVRLDVDNGTCGNFTEQEITIYEEPPIADFEVVGNLCADGEITFNNLTLDGSYPGPLTYEWDFNGQSTASTRDASFIFGSPGMKTVTLTSSIPGCENFFQTVIDLEPGPTSLFSAPSVCQNELLTFNNQSTDADSYEWDFGDGFTSTEPNTSHVYTTSGNFMVRLEAFDLAGCSAIYEQEVSISPEPIADYSYDIACKGNQGVEFIDQSSVESADILSWEWRVNDQLISTDQSPTLSFDETGNVEVSLSVISSNGCTNTYAETINVLEDPDPSFTSDISCQTQVSTFTDTSMNPEEIVSRVWDIEGQTYTSAEANHTFSGSGQIDVQLTITGQNFCSSTLYSTVEVPAAPVMDFSISSYCDNEEILFQDESTAADPIISRSWTLDGTPFFNGATASIEEIVSGNYTIALMATTQSGCEFSLEQPLDIVSAPEASFNTSATYGVPPFNLSLTNTSAGATNYQWLVNGAEMATSANANYSITEEGDYQVELVAMNGNGCEDRSTLNVISRLPAINLIANNLTLTQNGNSQVISLQVTNNGNLPIEIFDVFVSSSKNFSFSERINQFIDIDGEVDVQLTSALQANTAQRICIRIESAYDDISPDNNEACISFIPKVVFEDIYPNPFKDEAVVRFIMPKSGKVKVRVANSAGLLVINDQFNFEEGLQVLRFNSTQWEKGLYFVSVIYNDEMSTRRILKF